MGTVTVLPHGRALTRRDLERMPDDGHRYELVDGTLVVTPAPSTRHQSVLAQLHLSLAGQCPPDLQVLFAPLDVVLADDTVLQPDLLVARRSDFTARDLPGAPLLAAEVLEDGRYVERATVVAEESLELDRPFPLTIRPSDLTG